jgi:uncharacterized protein
VELSGQAAPASSARGKTIETHVSLLSFEGDVVRKRKKAVRFPFINLSEPELRLAACRQEVELNRRLAPDVYLGVEEIHDRDGRLMDAAVVMRRLPDDRQLSTLINARVDTSLDLIRVAHVLAAFHSRARRGADIDRAATREGLAARWEADLDEWDPLVKRVLDMPARIRARALVRRYLEGRGEMLERRIRDGHIVDGHGDLRADSIFCLADRPRLIDCLEFDEHLRFGDELADVAFLAMDLEALGRPDLAAHFVHSYGRFAAWTAPPGLLHFYIAHRAMVRSKVACWRAMQGDTAATPRARLHLEQCERHLEAARAVLVVIGGAPRTGKSTVAGALADATDYVHVRSDEIRRDLRSAPRIGGDSLDRGIYAPEVTARIYTVLAARARMLLLAGYSVILDATFPIASSRTMVRRIAQRCRADFVAIECNAPASVVRQRSRQERRVADLSEATPEVAAALRSRRAPWPDAHTLDTTKPALALITQCLGVIGATPIG